LVEDIAGNTQQRADMHPLDAEHKGKRPDRAGKPAFLRKDYRPWKPTATT
jgi:hypothetical protein